MYNRIRNTYTKHHTAVSYVHGGKILFTTDYFVFVLTTSWKKCTENIDSQTSHKIYEYSSSVFFVLLLKQKVTSIVQ